MLTQAQQVISSKSNFVLGGLFLELPPLFMSSLKTLGFKGSVINYHGGAVLSQLKQINDPKYYALRSWAYDTSKAPGVQAMDKAVRSIGGDPSGDYLPVGWGSAAIVAKALQICGFPCSGSKMNAALSHVGLLGTLGGVFSGPLGFPKGSHQAINYSQLWHYVNGHAVTVGPVYKAS
jgi:hypothetical protein